MLFRFCLYGFLKNQRYFEPFLVLIFLDRELSFFLIGVLLACRDLTVNLLEIPSGAIADVTGRRGSMMLSFVAYIISFVIFALAGPFWALATAMVLYGVGDSFRTGTHKAMIFEWLRLQNRSDEKTRVYGLTRSWSQIGSAVSGIIAAGFVLLSGNYQTIFWFATIPCILNLINFAGYPAELDGSHQKSSSPKAIARRLRDSSIKSFREPRLRGLMVEAISWEGYLAAVKDYLQPVLQLLAVISLAGLFSSKFNEAQQTALLIGPVYMVLFLLSAAASRNAHHFETAKGGPAKAAKQLWLLQGFLYLSLTLAAWSQWAIITALIFAALTILKNLWRPILISRFDELTDPEEGATVLSVESQARHASTLVFAPLMGWLVDQCGQQFWIVGAVGLGMVLVARGGGEKKLEALEDDSSSE